MLEARLAAPDAGAAAVGVGATVAKPAMEVGLGRIVALQHLLIVALLLCNTAHPRHTRFANIFGTFFLKRRCDRTLGGGPCVLLRTPARPPAVCRGTWARDTIDQFRRLALRTFYGHMVFTNILSVQF